MIFSHFLSVDENNSTKKYSFITLFINLDYTPLQLWNNSPSGYFGGAKYPSKADISHELTRTASAAGTLGETSEP